MYLVRECTTMSIPRSIGLSSAGVGTVLPGTARLKRSAPCWASDTADCGRGTASGLWARRGVVGYGRGMASPLLARTTVPWGQGHASPTCCPRFVLANVDAVGARPCLARTRRRLHDRRRAMARMAKLPRAHITACVRTPPCRQLPCNPPSYRESPHRQR